MTAELARALAWMAAIVCAAMLVRVVFSLIQRGRAVTRLQERGGPLPPAQDDPATRGALTRRLWLAGRRQPGAAASFVARTAILFLAGCVAAATLRATGLLDHGLASLQTLPGSIGPIAADLLALSPLFLAVAPALLPWLALRATRRRRVRAIEIDLPLTLDLLATMGEAGFGFDAAVARLVDIAATDRPLIEELRLAQSEVRAGMPRVRAMRHLASRIAVPSMTVFVSAVIQAEQVGASMAGVLRRQADDLRARRREEALARAQAMPVKLVFPLVSCFLPGLFVVTLGPAFHQFAQLADTAMRNIHH